MKRIAAFAALLALAILLLLPLRVALPGADIAAGQVSGTLWSGRMTAAEWRGLPLGDIEVHLAPAALLAGRAGWRVSGAAGSGQVWRGPGTSGATGLSASLPLAGALPLPLASATLDNLDIAFAGGGCRRAGGQVQVMPDGLLTDVGPLGGFPRCEGAMLLLPLASGNGETRLDLRLGGGRWQARLAMRTVPEARRAALLAAGFRQTPEGLVLERTGPA